MDVQQVFTSYDSPNQAIQPRVVGPLLKKGGKGVFDVSILELGLGPLWNVRPAGAHYMVVGLI